MEPIEYLESLLNEFDLYNNYTEICDLLNQIDQNQIATHLEEENFSTLLHMIVNKPIDERLIESQFNLFMIILNKGCNINLADVYGFTVLHYCCNYNLIKIAKVILDNHGFDPAIINFKTLKQLKKEKFYYLIGTTPLQICSWMNHLNLAELLIQHGAQVNDKNESGWSCTHICSRQNYIDFVKLLIKNQCNIDELNNSSKTPLHISARHNNHLITKILLESGANVNNKNKYGQTPLFVAVSKGHIKVIKLLLEYKSDPNQVDEQKNSPLHACGSLVEVLDNETIDQNYQEKKSSVYSYRNVRIADMLIEYGCDPKLENNLGCNVFHLAAKNNCENLIKYLILKFNFLVNSRDIYGQTPLYLACKWKSVDAAKVLLTSKLASKDLSDLSGMAPIHLCIIESSRLLLTMLVEFGDDVNRATNNSRDTPLHLAAKLNNTDMIEFLILKGADINRKNKDKKTPLHISAKHGADKACWELLKKGAKVNKTDDKGKTALHSAIESQSHQKSVKIAKILVNFGADINKEFEKSMNALSLCTMLGNVDVLRFLIDKRANIINSKYESVAHLCIKSNKCNHECMKLLIDNYGTKFLFKQSKTSFWTPLQLCIENKSNRFLQSIISCKNIQCTEWFEHLHSVNGFGVSPIAMAVSSQNYAFIQELIQMWFAKFHDTHHSIQYHTELEIDLENENSNSTDGIARETIMDRPKRFINKNLTSLSNLFNQIGYNKKKKDATNLEEGDMIENEMSNITSMHGCDKCCNKNICLFMPNWNDARLKSERYFLNVLIRDNEKLTSEILNTFIKTDILKWETLIYLDHIEPYEDLKLNNKSKYERPLTPIETIYIYNKSNLVIHPVVKSLINKKFYDFAQWPFWIGTIRSVCHLIIWTAFSIFEDYLIKHYYNGFKRVDKIILLAFVIIFFAWDVIEEIKQIYYLLRRLWGYENWVLQEYKNLKSKEKNENEKAKPSIDITKKLKYSLIDKEKRAIKSLPMPYKRVDNIIDWLISLLQLISLITHIYDIIDHSHKNAEIHLHFCYLTTIIIWIRQLLTVNGVFPGIELICMIRLISPNIYRFVFIYMRVFIPFLLLFYSMFGGPRMPQAILETNWRECESINYKIPYNSLNISSLNITYYENLCNYSVKVDGFSDFYDSIFTVFRMILANISDLDNMQLVQIRFSQIITTLFIILSNIIGLNFFIGLMSNVLSGGAFTDVESHKSLELLGYVLQQEWRLDVNRRQKHLDYIKNECSPTILDKKDVILINKDEIINNNKINPDDKNSNLGEINLKKALNDEILLQNLLNEVKEIRNETRELKKLFKSSNNFNLKKETL